MSVYVMLNGHIFTIDFGKFYTPSLLIDVKAYDIRCDMNNKFLFFIENPRVNIQLISGFFDFYFKSLPEEFMMGQVVSKILISYKTLDSIWEASDNLRNVIEFMPCVLFTKGLQLQEILIYMPFQKLLYLREIKCSFLPKTRKQCIICFDDERSTINVHQDKFDHCVCTSCLLRIDNVCPLCRQTIHIFEQAAGSTIIPSS